ncbi:MAG: 3'-5' exonuclease [Bacteroidales bacterium]|nr:3'-5' exonuclease [Bacteroidales bacterium]
MLDNYHIENILFLDIETVPQYPEHDHLPENYSGLWKKKASQLSRIEKFNTDDKANPDEIYDRAGIYAEFGKIVCISTGVMRNKTLWIKSFYSDDEKELLAGFTDMLSKLKQKNINYLCAHNGKEFDYPYLIRRMLINGIDVPAILDLSGKKPWEVTHLDTMELWKFGDFKNYTSLELLATVFNIPTPKDDIRGSDVARVYWKENDLLRIVAYCQKDVATIVNLFLRFKGIPLIGDDAIQIVS